RRRDVARRERGRRHLVEHRLEEMVVASVHHGHVHAGVVQSARGGEAAEPGTDDHDTAAGSRWTAGRHALSLILSPDRMRRFMATATTGKLLFRQVEKAIEAIEGPPDPSATIAKTASTVIEQFEGVLGVRGGRLYERRDGGYELVRTFGGAPAIPPGL